MAKPKPAPPTLPCPHCRGSGRVPVSSVYGETLSVLRAAGEMTGADLGRLLGIKATAANNRLAVLESHGLVTSRRDGRRRPFKALTP